MLNYSHSFSHSPLYCAVTVLNVPRSYLVRGIIEFTQFVFPGRCVRKDCFLTRAVEMCKINSAVSISLLDTHTFSPRAAFCLLRSKEGPKAKVPRAALSFSFLLGPHFLHVHLAAPNRDITCLRSGSLVVRIS